MQLGKPKPTEIAKDDEYKSNHYYFNLCRIFAVSGT